MSKCTVHFKTRHSKEYGCSNLKLYPEILDFESLRTILVYNYSMDAYKDNEPLFIGMRNFVGPEFDGLMYGQIFELKFGE